MHLTESIVHLEQALKFLSSIARLEHFEQQLNFVFNIRWPANFDRSRIALLQHDEACGLDCGQRPGPAAYAVQLCVAQQQGLEKAVSEELCSLFRVYSKPAER